MSAFLSVQHAARRLGVSPVTIRRWTATGFLPCTRTAGGHRRIATDDIEELTRAIGGSSHVAARRARERELDTIVETSLAVASEVDLQPLLAEIARRITRLLDCDFCAVSTYDPRDQAGAGAGRVRRRRRAPARHRDLRRAPVPPYAQGARRARGGGGERRRPARRRGRGRRAAQRRRPQPAHAAAGLPRRVDRPARGDRRPPRALLHAPGAAALPGGRRPGGGRPAQHLAARRLAFGARRAARAVRGAARPGPGARGGARRNPTATSRSSAWRTRSATCWGRCRAWSSRRTVRPAPRGLAAGGGVGHLVVGRDPGAPLSITVTLPKPPSEGLAELLDLLATVAAAAIEPGRRPAAPGPARLAGQPAS